MTPHLPDPNPCACGATCLCQDRSCPHHQREGAVQHAAQQGTGRTKEPSSCHMADCCGLGNAVEDCARRKCPFVGERREAEEATEKKDADRRIER